uniref:Bromo domain-containing protein n=1 Tax=Paramoeba aestuarina TaxID=180227 RepID=A0A7S4KI57_9EUKA|mmetsp:Transcript_19697/g.30835  ORF Transcript_19697/g.30835 Transcript_19697/m.30835 type:complete len:213 (+) Transcript_19697:56-694(+)
MSWKREGKKEEPVFTEIDVFIVEEVQQSASTFDPFVISSKIYASKGIAPSMEDVTKRFFYLVNTYGSFEKLYEVTLKKKAQGVQQSVEIPQVTIKSEVKQNLLAETLLECVNQISSSPLSDVFREPVEANIYMSFNNHHEGPYMTRVFRPMDLSTIRNHIQGGKIASWKSLLYSLTRISTNCVFFNSPDSEFPKRAMEFFDLCYATVSTYAK